jgi:hypothetical protein
MLDIKATYDITPGQELIGYEDACSVHAMNRPKNLHSDTRGYP